MSYKSYLKYLRWIRTQSYWKRVLFWIALYFYNRVKDPFGRFTLYDYISYARK